MSEVPLKLVQKAPPHPPPLNTLPATAPSLHPGAAEETHEESRQGRQHAGALRHQGSPRGGGARCAAAVDKLLSKEECEEGADAGTGWATGWDQAR